ncbi:MAG: hypothetical protein KBD79_10780 [Chitinophagales bacterium]|nr:hypothetical protein [Chitinophagales bacterium]
MDRNNQYEMKQPVTCLIILFPFLFIGCGGSVPAKNEITGIWFNADGAQLILKDDGTFTATSIPAELFFHDEYEGEKFGGNGKWTIEKERKSWDQIPWKVDLDFTETSNRHYRYGHSLLISGSNFLENKPPWRNLFLWKGEEGGERYEFKRK